MGGFLQANPGSTFMIVFKKSLKMFGNRFTHAFYLDVLKDRLYTTAPKSLARRSAQTALWQITNAMLRWMAPFLSFTAEEASQWGFVNVLTDAGGALEGALELAGRITANGPLAVQAILKTMRDSEGKHEEECWADDAKVGAAVFSSEDAKEGPRAFLEKRKPEFKGR